MTGANDRRYSRAMQSRLLVTVALTVALPGALPAQQPKDLVAQLLDPTNRTAATFKLKRHRAAGVAALLDAYGGGFTPDAPVYAQALAACGSHTGGALKDLIALAPRADEPARSSLLRAIANGVLAAPDADVVERLRDHLPEWLRNDVCFSPSQQSPTFAWFEYIRITRRLQLYPKRDSVAELRAVLDKMLREREAFPLPGLGAGVAPNVHDLGAFGAHGDRERLEAIAELALALGPPARPLVEELVLYLLPEKPRRGEIVTESGAGFGEGVPGNLAAARHPTLWRTGDWRLAIARAVLALSTDSAHRAEALRHLLLADDPVEQLEAFATLRTWPQPWTPFAAELTACLESPEPRIVREALLSFSADPTVPRPMEILQRLAASDVDDLRKLAQRLSAK